jgi:hypothetical protein
MTKSYYTINLEKVNGPSEKAPDLVKAFNHTKHEDLYLTAMVALGILTLNKHDTDKVLNTPTTLDKETGKRTRGQPRGNWQDWLLAEGYITKHEVK